MALQPRYIPPDAREDVKFFKVIPLESLYYAIGSLIIGAAIFGFFFRSNPLLGALFVIIPPIMILFIFTIDLPSKIYKQVQLTLAQRNTKAVNDLCSIGQFNTVCDTKKNRRMIFLENRVYPWELCPDAEKDTRANRFAQDILSTVKKGNHVDIYGICAPEDTGMLEARLESLSKMDSKLRTIEDQRISTHYNFSLSATAIKYYARISTGKDSGDSIIDIAQAFSEADIFQSAEIIGGDIIQDLVSDGRHLIIGSKEKRGRKKSDEIVEAGTLKTKTQEKKEQAILEPIQPKQQKIKLDADKLNKKNQDKVHTDIQESNQERGKSAQVQNVRGRGRRRTPSSR